MVGCRGWKKMVKIEDVNLLVLCVFLLELSCGLGG